MGDLANYLNMEYLKWQQSEGGRRTLQEFADYLEIDRPTLSNWMNGKRTPDDKSLEKLSFKLGLEIYKVMGKECPDPRLHFINKNWSKISEESKDRISEEVAKYDRKKADQQN